jgi:4-aminobutyrate aminotransferase
MATTHTIKTDDLLGGIYSNVIEVTPPLTLTREQADQGLAIVDQALSDVEAGRFPDEKLGMYAGW